MAMYLILSNFVYWATELLNIRIVQCTRVGHRLKVFAHRSPKTFVFVFGDMFGYYPMDEPEYHLWFVCMLEEPPSAHGVENFFRELPKPLLLALGEIFGQFDWVLHEAFHFKMEQNSHSTRLLYTYQHKAQQEKDEKRMLGTIPY